MKRFSPFYLAGAPARFFAAIPWSLGRKIQLILLLLMLIILAGSLVSIFLLFNLKQDHQLEKEASTQVGATESLNQKLEAQLDLYNNGVLGQEQQIINDPYLVRLKKDLAGFTITPAIANSSYGQNLKGLLADLQAQYLQVAQVLTQLNEQIAQGQSASARKLWLDNSLLLNGLKEKATSLKQNTLAAQSELSQGVENSIDSSTTITFATVIVMLFCLSGVALFLTTVIGGAMGKLKRDLDTVAAGELNLEFQTPHRDEIGEVVTVLNQALKLVRQVIASSAIGREVNWLAEHLASTSREQSSISEEQATIVAQILSFLEELAQKVQTVLDNSINVAKAAHSVLAEAGEVRQSASDVDGSSLQLQEVVINSLAITGRVREHAEQLADELNQFAGQSQQIMEVTSFIDNIAFRTHILAINAAIEAAQAGEFGERFSVVAQEVKNLAREITGNTEKIRVKLEVTREKIQQSAQNAVNIAQEMEQLRNSERVVNGEVLSLVGTTRNSVEKAGSIVEAAKTMVTLSQQIETLVQQHQVASLQAVSSLAQIKNAAQTNNQATRMLEEDALKLEGLSKQLNLALARVRLN